MSIPFRQIHLDFHTSPHISGVGEKFNAEKFADTLVQARVNSVTLFAKCHHGHLYYDTPHPARHPSLQRPLLEEQVAVLKSRGIRCPIYLSVLCDEYAANTHPEWVALGTDGKRAGREPLTAHPFSWQVLDMSSPYADYLADQIDEVMTRFAPVDGLFLDLCWDMPSVTHWAMDKMQQQGLDPANEKDRTRYAAQVTQDYMRRYCDLIASHQKDVPVWFNSRPLSGLDQEKQFLKHIEIEALPTGQWGYAHFPVNVRYAKTLGLPMLGMTGRFHKSWADFGGLRTASSLLYDCAQALAHGAGCSVGDQLHPTGLLDAGAYEIIGEVYSYVEKCEPLCRDVDYPKEIAFLLPDQVDYYASLAQQGVCRLLTPLGYQYVFLKTRDRWEDYPLVVLMEGVSRDASLDERLKSYLHGGGKVVHEMPAGEESPFTTTYLRFDASARGTLPQTDHVFYERGIRLSPAPGDRVLATIIEPYFERQWNHFCSHAQTPAKLEPSPYAAGVIRGSEAILALPVFRAYAQHGNIPCRQLVAAALSALLPDPVLKLVAPTYVEALVNTRGQDTFVHLLSFIPQKRTATLEMVEEKIPARNLTLDVKVAGTVNSVESFPSGAAIPFVQAGNRVSLHLDWIEGHEIVAIHC